MAVLMNIKILIRLPDFQKLLFPEINKDFRYNIYIVKKARLYTDTINDTAVIQGQKVIKEPSFQIRNTIFLLLKRIYI